MIVRMPNELRDSYTVISDELLANPTVSTEALGVYCYLLSKPSNWVIRSKQIANVFSGIQNKPISPKRIKRRLNELKDAGYVERRHLNGGAIITTILKESSKTTVTNEQIKGSETFIVKLSHKDRDRFTKIDNSIFRDPNITLKAIGMLCHALTNKNDWNYNKKYFTYKLSSTRSNSISRKGVSTIMDKLISEGYVEKVATGNKPISFNQDYVFYESNASALKLSDSEKAKIKDAGLVDVSELRQNDLVESNSTKDTSSSNGTDIICSDVTFSDVTFSGVTFSYVTRRHPFISIINTPKQLNTKTTPYHPLLKSSPTAKKTLVAAGENSKQNSKQNLKDNSQQSSQEKLSHVKQNSESDGSRDQTRLTRLTRLTRNRAEEIRIRKALRELSFPKPFDTKDRTIKILLALSRANVSNEPILREELYECIQSKINDIAVLAKDKSSGIKWEKGIPILIRSQVKEEAPRFLMTENIFDEKITRAAENKADSYQKMLDRWDELCKSNSKNVALHSPNILLDDHAIAVAIFSNSEESRAKMHPQKSECLSEHYDVTTYLTDLKQTFKGLKDKVTKESLEILAERKGITNLVSYLEQLSINDFDYLLEDNVYRTKQVN